MLINILDFYSDLINQKCNTPYPHFKFYQILTNICYLQAERGPSLWNGSTCGENIEMYCSACDLFRKTPSCRQAMGNSQKLTSLKEKEQYKSFTDVNKSMTSFSKFIFQN